MRGTSFILGMLLCSQVRAGGDPLPVGARQAGMGHAAITLIDLWCVHHNQAGLAGLEAPIAGGFFQAHFLSEELTQQGLAFALPMGKGTLAASMTRFGYSLYNESKFGVAYAMDLSDAVRVGVQLDYMGITLGEGYGSTGGVTAEIGVQAKLTEKLWMGAHLFNPTRMELGGPYDDRVPTLLRAGLGYSFSDKFLMTAQMDKDIDLKEQVRVGAEYHPSDVLFLRAGVSTDPSQMHFGVGLRLKQFDVDLASAFRSQLGPTPQLGLTYRFQ